MRFKLLFPCVFVMSCISPEGGGFVSEPSHAPRPSFTLSVEERNSLAAPYDVAALESFLALHQPEERAQLLRTFRGLPDKDGNVSTLMRVSDPQKQQLLEQIWAPVFARLPHGELARVNPELPGAEKLLRSKGLEVRKK